VIIYKKDRIKGKLIIDFYPEHNTYIYLLMDNSIVPAVDL